MAHTAGKGGLLKGATGATLIELMIGMSISVIIMLAVVMVIQTQGKSSSREVDRVDLYHSLQNATVRVEKDLLMAGYQTVDSSLLYTGAITTAGLNTITFLYDTDGNVATGDAKGRETITFRLDTAADAGYNAPHPRLLKVTATGIFTVGSDITGVTFAYYDSAGAVTAVLSDIRSVKVTLNGRSPRLNRDTGAYITATLTIRVTPRNFG